MNEQFDCMYFCAPHACRAHGDQKRASDPLGLEVQMVVNVMWMMGSEPSSSGRASSTLSC